MTTSIMERDTVGAFILPVDCAHAPAGVLAGRRFAVKDLFDVAGHPTGFGSPHWLATHPVPQVTASSIQALLDAGGELVAKAHTDELAYSLAGRNVHYGAPLNVNAPGRNTGGSSSGSAAAMAARLVDFTVGSDTGGSVRIPASLCGVLGIRTTWGRIPMDGAAPLAPSFDTFGWFARDAGLMEAVAGAVFPRAGQPLVPARVWLPDDVTALLETRIAAPLLRAAETIASRLGARLDRQPVAAPDEDLADWAEVFRVHQAAEAWQCHGEWILTHAPPMGEDVAQRFDIASRISDAEYRVSVERRAQIRERLLTRLDGETLLLLPGAPDIALRADASPETVQAFRSRAFRINCIAGLGGLPQVVMPWMQVDGCPVGIGIAGLPDRDEALLEVARELL
ncbi:amidase [Aquisalimonas asiatica]|uniref:Amidase n=1 Tax=Aquisalimonas asiatica TaxID=406100 RepID=A0A1H8S0H4_9GAMM|nr:amidase [Aquisalimonas asiatica]SEO71848.1 amidase [Aquisalimonas asiatica]